jgi:hypothetical protein
LILFLLFAEKRESVMTSAGMFITAIIIGFEIVIFACLKGSPEAGAFYLSGADQSAHLITGKTLEGE